MQLNDDVFVGQIVADRLLSKFSSFMDEPTSDIKKYDIKEVEKIFNEVRKEIITECTFAEIYNHLIENGVETDDYDRGEVEQD